MQGGGRPGLRILAGAADLVSIDARPLMLAFAICGGAAIYFALPEEPRVTSVLAITGAAFAVWVMARRWWTSEAAIMVIVILLGVSLGLAAGTVRSILVDAPVVQSETGPVMVEGWVQDIEPGRKGVRLMIKVHSVAGMAPSEWPYYVRVTHTSRLEVAPGRFVRCWSVLRPPPGPAMPGEYDFRRQAWFEQLGAVGYVQGRCRGGALGAPPGIFSQVSLWLGALRRNLAVAVNEAAGERAGGFAAALVTGDRSLVPPEDDEALRDTGLTHILSISGMHLSIVGGLVFLLVKRTLVLIEPLALRIAVQKPAAIVALLACFAYMVLSGSSVPAQRAFIMAAIVFGAIIADRSPISLRTFAIAMMAVVLFQPESVVTPGFQMSFAATGALVAAFDVWRRKRSGQETVLGPIATGWISIMVTSLAAGLATMPYILFHFDRATPIGFVANLVAAPIVSFLSAPSAALALILAPFGHAEFGLRLFGYSLELLLEVAHFFARFSDEPGTSDKPMPLAAMILATLAIMGFIAATGWLRLISCFTFAAASLGVWNLAPRFVAHWSASGDLFIAQDGRVERIPLIAADGLSPLRFSEADTAECDGEVCRFQTPSGVTIEVSAGEEPTVCYVLSPKPASDAGPGCDSSAGGSGKLWRWADVSHANGLTAFLDDGSLRITAAPTCGDRPWHACSEGEGARAE